MLPTRAMKEKDVDYAVSFAVQVDAPGLQMIAKPAAEAPFSSIMDIEQHLLFSMMCLSRGKKFSYVQSGNIQAN